MRFAKNKVQDQLPKQFLHMSVNLFSMLIYCLRHMGVYWVCQEGSVIESSANLGMHGQGLLKLSGHGDSLRAQRLFVSLFYTVHVSCQLSHECYQYLFFMDVSCWHV